MCISSTNFALQANEQETARLRSCVSGFEGELKHAREAVADMARSNPSVPYFHRCIPVLA